MYRSRDFVFMDVMDINGKKLGFVKDIQVDFNKGYVEGFYVSSNKLFKKDVIVLNKDIIAFNSKMIVKQITQNNILNLKDFKGMDIIDIKGNILGKVEDIIFSSNTFKITGIIASTGIIRNLMCGKKVFVINELILGEKNILYFKEKSKIQLTTVLHNALDVDVNE